MTARALTNDILRALSDRGYRLFRNNVGLGWVGKSQRYHVATTVMVNPGDVVIRAARPLHAGLCVGSSDIIGWSPTGQFTAVEVKYGKDRETPEQENFREQVNLAGGLAVVCRDVEELRGLVL